MMLLVCFDLPRDTKENRKEATKYHKKLVELGFTMKQFSVYEREVRQNSTRDRVIKVLKDRLPKSGAIILYLLPNEVNDSQITILGSESIRKTVRKPQFIVV
ncbi:CRISPR-associated endonuclease Cas2 [Ligilactobacillus salivarius]|uniref:CRISPR-associated endonuclease Cas2 n=1 Tax=Ligilactobacillus salivarius TaxID=1624 RepID=UPI003C2D1118